MSLIFSVVGRSIAASSERMGKSFYSDCQNIGAIGDLRGRIYWLIYPRRSRRTLEDGTASSVIIGIPMRNPWSPLVAVGDPPTRKSGSDRRSTVAPLHASVACGPT